MAHLRRSGTQQLGVFEERARTLGTDGREIFGFGGLILHVPRKTFGRR